MKTICVINDQSRKWNAVATWLIRVEDDADPMDAIKEIFEGDECWEDIKDDIEWFYLKPDAAGILNAIEWPETYDDAQRQLLESAKAAIYRALGIRKISLTEALGELDSNIINRALGLGWKPPSAQDALAKLYDSTEPSALAERFAEDLMCRADDDNELVAIEAATIFEYEAGVFLKEDSSLPKPEARE